MSEIWSVSQSQFPRAVGMSKSSMSQSTGKEEVLRWRSMMMVEVLFRFSVSRTSHGHGIPGTGPG
jgi:hypothetical protein